MRVKQRGDALWLWCPGCRDAHRIVVGEGKWTWDGDPERPTVAPSIKVTGVQWEESSPFHRAGHDVLVGQPTICHSFLQVGKWRFLTDSTHVLAGQTVPMVDLPDWLATGTDLPDDVVKQEMARAEWLSDDDPR